MCKNEIGENLCKLFSLENKVILMTGGAGQIGSVIAKAYAGLGAKVVIADIDEEALKEVEEVLNYAY